MEPLAEALSANAVADWMRVSRWGYAGVNAAHVVGLGLLFGAVATLDLRLLGAWRSLDLAALARALVPVAAAGLALAALSGALLCLAAPADYLASPLFLAKLGLVAAGAVHALAIHMGPGIARLGPGARRRAGALSLGCWLSVLVAGRMLGFVLG